MDKKIKATPLGENILIQQIAAAKTSKGGIIIPDGVDDDQGEGIVISIGPKYPHSITGKHIIFNLRATHRKVVLGGQELLVLKPEEIYCVLEEVSDEEDD